MTESTRVCAGKSRRTPPAAFCIHTFSNSRESAAAAPVFSLGDKTQRRRIIQPRTHTHTYMRSAILFCCHFSSGWKSKSRGPSQYQPQGQRATAPRESAAGAGATAPAVVRTDGEGAVPQSALSVSVCVLVFARRRPRAPAIAPPRRRSSPARSHARIAPSPDSPREYRTPGRQTLERRVPFFWLNLIIFFE